MSQNQFINLNCEKAHRCFGGTVGYYVHESQVTQTKMRFSLFLPPQQQKSSQEIPLFLFLSGLTCTEDNFTTKAGAYAKASELGIAILAPDTSPRGEGVPDHETYDLGQGASFYLDAIKQPWATHFQMESYLTEELLPLVKSTFLLAQKKIAICGHSMGGHGALTLYLKYADLFQSCSAFAPIVAPSSVPWGQKAFKTYLGDDQSLWRAHDACLLMHKHKNASARRPILIDQGLNDSFLQNQLKPELFQKACESVGQKLILRQQAGYDHSYFFIQSFIDEHLEWHSQFIN